jgi:hypothetical protein
MNNKQRKTFDTIFNTPTPSNLKYDEIVSLLKSVGVQVKESASGSRVLIKFKECTQVIHKPHLQKELKQYAVRIIKEFLINAGIKI